MVNDGAVFNTTSASGTKIHVDITRSLSDFDLEFPLLAGNAFHFRQGQYFNVDVPADLDQFGRNNSHGTVIGRKRLVKL